MKAIAVLHTRSEQAKTMEQCRAMLFAAGVADKLMQGQTWESLVAEAPDFE